LTCHVAVPGRPFEIVIGPCAVPAAIHPPVPLQATFEILRSIGRFRGAGQNIQTQAEIAANESAITTALPGVRGTVGFFNERIGPGIPGPYNAPL
jgi:hypothetical protein